MERPPSLSISELRWSFPLNISRGPGGKEGGHRCRTERSTLALQWQGKRTRKLLRNSVWKLIQRKHYASRSRMRAARRAECRQGHFRIPASTIFGISCFVFQPPSKPNCEYYLPHLFVGTTGVTRIQRSQISCNVSDDSSRCFEHRVVISLNFRHNS